MPDIIEGTNNLIDDCIKTYKLERLSEVTINTLCKHYCTCTRHCIFYKQHKQMLSSFEEMPIHPALLSLKAMEQKNLKNNLYLYHAIIKDVDIGVRTCNFCGLNMHIKCGYRVLDIVESLLWTCLPCYQKKYSPKLPTSEITKSVSIFEM